MSSHSVAKTAQYAPLEPMAQAFLPSGPWVQCAADILSHLPSGKSLLVVVDYLVDILKWLFSGQPLTQGSLMV